MKKMKFALMLFALALSGCSTTRVWYADDECQPTTNPPGRICPQK